MSIKKHILNAHIILRFKRDDVTPSNIDDVVKEEFEKLGFKLSHGVMVDGGPLKLIASYDIQKNNSIQKDKE